MVEWALPPTARFQSTLPLRGATSLPRMSHASLATFQSTLPLRGATAVCCPAGTSSIFQSTLPLRGATWKWYYDKFPQLISIHTPLAGSDQPVRRYWKAWLNFNPHSPCGERPHRNPSRWFLWNFNPHSPCGERHEPAAEHGARLVISIHTPLAGSDRQSGRASCGAFHFNPHSPCGERPEFFLSIRTLKLFQSTLPLRGATFCRQLLGTTQAISIHTPLAGSD